jgi:hypothetical protein
MSSFKHNFIDMACPVIAQHPADRLKKLYSLLDLLPTGIENVDLMSDTIVNGAISEENLQEMFKFSPMSYDMGSIQSQCNHEYVDVGFTVSKMVCKHCDKDQA